METAESQYIYIVQSSSQTETSRCKIGKTNDLERRLKEYNNMTGKSKDVVYQYLFTCEVKNMSQIEKDIKEKYSFLREQKSREIYLYNPDAFKMYVDFIKSHKLFVKEIFVKTEPKSTITEVIVKKITPSLETRGIAPINVINQAKKIKNDEFYTRYEDIEKEIKMYDKEIWKDKVVFCNCDDAVDDDERKTSAFVQYFKNNFKELGLKKLICTHYSGGVDLFQQGSKAYIAYIYIFTDDGGLKLEKKQIKGYDGSFDHPESIRILNEEADIVCTNPPFSKSIEYWKILIESGKKFLVISNHNIVLTTAYIPYFKDNLVWAGYNRVCWYLNTKWELVEAPSWWFTNLSVKDRPKYKQLKIIPLKKIPVKYKKYDDSKTLLVDNCYIPSDYRKPFAVSSFSVLNGILEKGYEIIDENESYMPIINDKKKFRRVLIQKIEK